MEQPHTDTKGYVVGDLNDNILPFRPKKPDDEENIIISLDEEGISQAFDSLRVASVGLINDRYSSVEAGDIVHGAIILISWMAKESGVSMTELLEFFRSIELEDFED